MNKKCATQDIAYVKFEIWMNGGPIEAFQKLLVAGSDQPLDDWMRLDEVLPRGASLQLINTTPPTTTLHVSAIVDPDFTCCATKFTIPFYNDDSDVDVATLTGYVQYLGDATVDSTASGDEIAFQVQEQFSTVPLDPHIMIFVLKHYQSGRCRKIHSIQGTRKQSFLQLNETFLGVWTVWWRGTAAFRDVGA